MAKKQSTGMIIRMVISAETPDTSGETLLISGLDTSSIDTVDGVPVNWDHRSSKKDDGDDTSYGAEIVGKLLEVHKIYDLKDCRDDWEKAEFKRVNKVPIATATARLYDGAGHPSAINLAAIIRDNAANNEPINLRASVEGSTLERDGMVLKSTILRKLALTDKPCLKAVSTVLLQDPNAPEGFEKAPQEDPLDALGLDKTQPEDPFCHPLGKSLEAQANVVCDPTTCSTKAEIKAKLKVIYKTKMIKAALATLDLKKALTAGSTDVAPSELTNGSALAAESTKRSPKDRALAVIKASEGKSRDELHQALSDELPEVPKSFIKYFVDVAEDFKVKKQAIKKHLPDSFVCTAEAYTIELRKAEAAIEQPAHQVLFAKQKVTPGLAETEHDKYELLHENDTHYVGRKLGTTEPEDLVKLPKSKANSHYRVVLRPSVYVSDLK